MEHDLRLCPSERVDGLVIIPHDKEVILGRCQQLYNVILKLIDVLELIHKHIPELILPTGQDIFSSCQKVITVQQHVIEIQKPGLSAGIHIGAVNLSECVIRAVGGIIMLYGHPAVLYNGDFLYQPLKKLLLVVDPHSLAVDDFL